MDLNTISFVLLGGLVASYAVLDGFDLGVGAISLMARSKEDRDLHVACIGPVWDGNQVWLLAAGDVLFGGFPLAFATILSGFYIAFILLLVALMARAVAVEFRLMRTSLRWVRFWDWAYGLGSLCSALILGVAFGNVLRGLPIGPGFEWKGSFPGLLNPYAILIGLLACTLFVMHGALYLWMKTEHELSDRNRRIAFRAYGVFLAVYSISAAVSLHVSPFLFRKAGSPVFSFLTALLVAALASIPIAIRSGKKGAAFLASSATIVLMIAVTAFSVYPVLAPSILGPDLSLTIYNAASLPGTQVLMIAVALIGMPIMLVYTFAVYRVFRGVTRLAARGEQ